MNKIIKFKNYRIVTSEVVSYYLIYHKEKKYWSIQFLFKNKEVNTIYITKDLANEEELNIIIEDAFEYLDSFFI